MEKVQEMLRVLLPVAVWLWLVGSGMGAAGGIAWRWCRARTRFGRLEALRDSSQKRGGRGGLILGMGVGLGIWTGSILIQSMPELWVLVLVILIALLLEELREPKRLAVLPDVVQFLTRYRAAIAEGHDVYGALAATAEELPPGEVLRAVERALDKQLRHLPYQEVFWPLEKVSPYLQEFVLILKNNGWKGSENLEAGLGMIVRRAVGEVDQTSRARLRFKQIQPIIFLGKAWLAGSVLAVVPLSADTFLFKAHIVELDRFELLISLIALVLMVYLIFSQIWLRRGMVIGCIVILLIFGMVWKRRKASLQVLQQPVQPQRKLLQHQRRL